MTDAPIDAPTDEVGTDPPGTPVGVAEPVGSGPPRTGRRRWLRRTAAALGAAVAVLVVLVTTTAVLAATSPGNESFEAKWADWLRAHHAAFLVAPLEQWYYTSHQPPKGGRPHHLNAVPHAGPAQPAAPPIPHLPAPTAVPLVVSPALPGEGQWVPTGPRVHGYPGMYVAQFRADTVYTSQITSAVWIDPHLLRVRLVPGQQEPGGTWTVPPDIPPADFPTAVAAFNGGFRFQDARGGFFLDGHEQVPLRAGAASIVIHTDGLVDVGAWGTEVSMAPDVEAVLQNLVPLIDNGQIAQDVTYSDNAIWGYTLGADTVVARSGVGVTADGALVYVAGPALTVRTLAEALQRCGAVRAMVLDLNPAWVTFNIFSHPDPTDPSVISATKLYPEMQRPATRYLGPDPESRDFFSVSTS